MDRLRDGLVVRVHRLVSVVDHGEGQSGIGVTESRRHVPPWWVARALPTHQATPKPAWPTASSRSVGPRNSLALNTLPKRRSRVGEVAQIHRIRNGALFKRLPDLAQQAHRKRCPRQDRHIHIGGPVERPRGARAEKKHAGARPAKAF